MCRSYLKFISNANFISLLIALIDTCARKQLFEISHYCLVAVVCYVKQVFHLPYDKSGSPRRNYFTFH